jgi:hypothetical protein
MYDNPLIYALVQQRNQALDNCALLAARVAVLTEEVKRLTEPTPAANSETEGVPPSGGDEPIPFPGAKR